MPEVIAQFSLLILVVLAVSFLMRLLKQPLIIGYIISGVLSGPFVLDIIKDTGIINVFSEFGISFLLFLVGMNLSPRIVKDVGKISVVTGGGQIVFTSIIGYFISSSLGFSPLTSIYIAVALTFSSTIIIMKLLSDRDDIEKLYGKISIGFLLVQDFAAMLALMFISSLEKEGGAGFEILKTLAMGFGLIAALVLFTRCVLFKITDFLVKSQEFLFLFVIVWGLGLAFLFHYAGLSMEIGALVAGVLFSTTNYNYAVASKMKVLRDFFIIFFFVFLGSQLVFEQILEFTLPALVFSLFILIGNPLVVMILMGIFRYSKRTGFQAGLTVAQISEFSLILVALGVKAGHVSEQILSLVTFVGILTIAGSTYLIMYSDRIYPRIADYLSVFERKKLVEREMPSKRFSYFLIGYNRTGFAILQSFQKMYTNFLVIDFNPEIIKILKKKGVNCLYGDADDSELLDTLKIDRASMVVSTVPDVSTNLMLLKTIRGKNKKTVIIINARQISDAMNLYAAGADYVILPHILGGHYAAKLIEELKTGRENYDEERKKQIQELRERLRHGQEEPLAGKENG
jgi:Kef-type K+ transport system membrane component KefB/voltage-gated potassium channel Kch